MKDTMTLEEIRNRFIEIEKDHDVFNLKYKKVYFWKLIRFDLYSYVLKTNGIFEDAHPFTFKQKLLRLVRLLKYSGHNLIKKRKIKKSNILILTHGRKTLINNKYQDAYLVDYIEELNKSNEDFLIIDRPDHSGNHLTDYSGNYIYFERYGHLIREVLYKLFSWHYNFDALKAEIMGIENDLKQNLKIDISLNKMIKKKIFRFKFEKGYFDKLLDQVEPEKIVLVVSYGKEELIASANERNIKVTEVQHGIINDFHMGYFFPHKVKIPYFPDKLILFGEYWTQSIIYPSNCKLEIGRFSFFKTSGNNISTIKDEQVLFISQGTIGKLMANIAVNFIKNNNINCLYKLHPSEFNIWKESYYELYKMSQSGRIKVIADEVNINRLFQDSKYIIGHNSTAIFEALKFNCLIYILNLEGYQYMNYLINNNYVKLISTNFTMEDLSDHTMQEIDKNMIFNSKKVNSNNK